MSRDDIITTERDKSKIEWVVSHVGPISSLRLTRLAQILFAFPVYMDRSMGNHSQKVRARRTAGLLHRKIGV